MTNLHKPLKYLKGTRHSWRHDGNAKQMVCYWCGLIRYFEWPGVRYRDPRTMRVSSTAGPCQKLCRPDFDASARSLLERMAREPMRGWEPEELCTELGWTKERLDDRMVKLLFHRYAARRIEMSQRGHVDWLWFVTQSGVLLVKGSERARERIMLSKRYYYEHREELLTESKRIRDTLREEKLLEIGNIGLEEAERRGFSLYYRKMAAERLGLPPPQKRGPKKRLPQKLSPEKNTKKRRRYYHRKCNRLLVQAYRALKAGRRVPDGVHAELVAAAAWLLPE